MRLSKEILHEIDPELTDEDLDNIIEEVDEDGSGTLDFDGKPPWVFLYSADPFQPTFFQSFKK